MANMIRWFEIPVTDMERAMSFYEKVFRVKLSRHKLGPLDMAWFPYEKDCVSGALVFHSFYKPSPDGVLVYFASEDVSDELGRIVSSGGKILQEKKEIGGGHGFMCLLMDSEGNRIAIHSMK